MYEPEKKPQPALFFTRAFTSPLVKENEHSET
jgi:hypothetical protein